MGKSGGKDFKLLYLSSLEESVRIKFLGFNFAQIKILQSRFLCVQEVEACG